MTRNQNANASRADDGGDPEDAAERAGALVVAGRAAHEDPGLSSRRSTESAPNSSTNSADERDENADADAAREVIGLRAEPQTGDRNRAPAEQAEHDHRGQQDAGDRAVDALPRIARVSATCGSGSAPCQACARRTGRRCHSGRCASCLCSQLCGLPTAGLCERCIVRALSSPALLSARRASRTVRRISR